MVIDIEGFNVLKIKEDLFIVLEEEDIVVRHIRYLFNFVQVI